MFNLYYGINFICFNCVTNFCVWINTVTKILIGLKNYLFNQNVFKAFMLFELNYQKLIVLLIGGENALVVNFVVIWINFI